jgi:hypothetical protein
MSENESIKVQKRGRKKKVIDEEDKKNEDTKIIKNKKDKNDKKDKNEVQHEEESDEVQYEKESDEVHHREESDEVHHKEESVEVLHKEESDEVQYEEESDEVQYDEEKEGTQKIKKKRGRKPKNEVMKFKEENKKEDIQQNTTYESTGENSEEEEAITYKKRGRKPRPKEKIYNIKEVSYENYDEDKNETLILHLPIKSNDIFSSNTPKGINALKTPIATYNLDGSYEKVQIHQIENKKYDNTQSYENNIETEKYEDILKGAHIEKKDFKIVFEENIEEENKVNIIEEYDKKVKEFKEFRLGNYVKTITNVNKLTTNMDDEIHGGSGTLLKDLENEQNTLTNFKVNPFMESTHVEEEIIQEHTNKMNKKNLKNILVEFINSNMYQEWPDQTNIHCWWCSHQFDGPPCTLPEYIRRDKFYVSGCFCSFNCAASYNFNKNDNGVWERYTLLNLMYKKLYNTNFVKIEMAPPREVLKMFGGYMSIEEFRNYCIKQDRKFQIIKPPLISIIPKIEEHIYPKNKVVNENIVNNTQTKLKLTRSKPLIAEKSTIQTFMNITAKKDDE